MDTLADGQSLPSEGWTANGRDYHLGGGKIDGKVSCVMRLTPHR